MRDIRFGKCQHTNPFAGLVFPKNDGLPYEFWLQQDLKRTEQFQRTSAVKASYFFQKWYQINIKVKKLETA